MLNVFLLSVCLLMFNQDATAQCDPINGSTDWIQHNGASGANYYIYDDGTNIRHALKADNNRLANGSNAANTVVKETAGADLNTEYSQITITYKAANTTGANNWMIGWSANPEFIGAGSTSRIQAANPTATQYQTQWLANILLGGSAGTTMAINTAQGATKTISTADYGYTAADGDVITATLIPQPDGTAALTVKVYRPSVGYDVFNTTYYAAVNAASVANGDIYPVLYMTTGASNVACLSAVADTYTPSTFAAPSCQTINSSTDWLQRNGASGANYYIYDDGTNIRHALKTNNNRLANGSTAANAIVKTSGGANLATDYSQISITYKTANSGGANNWVLGWTANPDFTGNNGGSRIQAANPTATQYETMWLANILFAGGTGQNMAVNTSEGVTKNINTSQLDYNGQDGDIITATLIPEPDGTASLNVKVYRPSLGRYVLNTTYRNAVNAASVAHGPIYPALYLINGETNVSCLSSTTGPLSALPVGFGRISGKISNDQLVINWQTLTESNNDHFEIEASADGKNFTKIGTVASQATDGNSSQPLNYEFSIEAAGASALMGIGSLILLAGSLMAKRRNRKIIGLSALSFMVFAATFVSCNKKGDALDVSGNKPLYIRIAQVDKDGKKAYSEVVKVFNQK
ncbi:autotransporter outer membrane beta-barrel domain-containing protein [Niabella ginsengisoli]|uniref:LPXTG cell wall anchor domain-containing protein n=1 Tax=Niabella ginsengisoli TaxID=522298 RepID=A0ABS9SPV1_9BACT|nr:hypothetical protein [Niabella ginsengisoli]MCH5600139.1 hypothetical protein [Niabella ginsengisoli]